MSRSGCAALAWSNTRRHSATTRSTSRLLPNLTAEDLKDLGVTTVGHRRRLLEAIAALREPRRDGQPCKRSARRARAAPQAGSRTAAGHGDVLRSGRLDGAVSRLDPEDLREVIGRYHACVAETVSRFDGFVAKYMGDGVLVYFGYPQAHEDDAEQAVRAGLALVDAVGELRSAGTRCRCASASPPGWWWSAI